MTRKYVILTRSFTGLSGNPRYVNFKCKYLKENGWDVVVIYNHNIGEVELEYVKPYAKNVIHELQFFPSWFNCFDRNRVLRKMERLVGTADQIVIESNKLQLSAWGEMLARRLKAKHITFVTTERICIKNKPSFDYFYSKLLRNEFFAINSSMAKNLFKNFPVDVDLTNYYWSASNGVEVKDIPFPVFDNRPKADFTISHFGRRKEYVSNMVREICDFTSSHPDKTFNIFFLGDLGNKDDVVNGLKRDNVNLAFSMPLETIPLSFIQKSDIIIATAGCASIVKKNRGMALSMCVTDNEPLGLLGYTTLDSNTRSGKYNNPYTVSEWLEKVLIEKEHYEFMDNQLIPHSFDYQMKFINEPDGMYIDSSKVNEKLSAHDKLWSTLMKLGLSKPLVELFYYKNRKHIVL